MVVKASGREGRSEEVGRGSKNFSKYNYNCKNRSAHLDNILLQVPCIGLLELETFLLNTQ